MAQGPSAKGRRILKKKTSARRTLRKTPRKQRSQISGSFHMKARREVILGGSPGQTPPKRYVKSAGGVVDFGGEVVIEDAALGRDERDEVMAVIENETARAEARDPQNSLLSVRRVKGRTVVRTAKNNLAVAIGKRLHRARKGGELTVTWSHHDMPVRVRWCPA